jgi:hypothetical protein
MNTFKCARSDKEARRRAHAWLKSPSHQPATQAPFPRELPPTKSATTTVVPADSILTWPVSGGIRKCVRLEWTSRLSDSLAECLPASPRQGSIRLTLKLQLRCGLVTERDPAGDGYQPGLETVRRRGVGGQHSNQNRCIAFGNLHDLREIEFSGRTPYAVRDPARAPLPTTLQGSARQIASATTSPSCD